MRSFQPHMLIMLDSVFLGLAFLTFRVYLLKRTGSNILACYSPTIKGSRGLTMCRTFEEYVCTEDIGVLASEFLAI